MTSEDLAEGETGVSATDTLPAILDVKKSRKIFLPEFPIRRTWSKQFINYFATGSILHEFKSNLIKAKIWCIFFYTYINYFYKFIIFIKIIYAYVSIF